MQIDILACGWTPAGPNSPAHVGYECSTDEDVSDSASQFPCSGVHPGCGGVDVGASHREASDHATRHQGADPSRPKTLRRVPDAVPEGSRRRNRNSADRSRRRDQLHRGRSHLRRSSQPAPVRHLRMDARDGVPRMPRLRLLQRPMQRVAARGVHVRRRARRETNAAATPAPATTASAGSDRRADDQPARSDPRSPTGAGCVPAPTRPEGRAEGLAAHHPHRRHRPRSKQMARRGEHRRRLPRLRNRRDRPGPPHRRWGQRRCRRCHPVRRGMPAVGSGTAGDIGNPHPTRRPTPAVSGAAQPIVPSVSGGTSRLGPGIDIRGPGRILGGYLAGPGSIVDGREYVIEVDAPIEWLPGWLAALIGRRSQ